MNERLKKNIFNFIPLITVAVIVLVWYLIAIGINTSLILPKPHETFNAFINLLSDRFFYSSVFYTTMRALFSFAIALLLAVVLALLSVQFKFFEKLFYPIIILVRAVPTMSIIFLCLIWFKSKISPLIVSFTVIFPVLYSSVLSAIKNCDKSIIEMSKLYRVPKKQMIAEFYLPSVSARVFSDAVSTLSLNVKLTIAAEALAQTAFSIGRYMQVAKANLETAELFAYTLAAILISLFLELIIILLSHICRRKRYAKA